MPHLFRNTPALLILVALGACGGVGGGVETVPRPIIQPVSGVAEGTYDANLSMETNAERQMDSTSLTIFGENGRGVGDFRNARITLEEGDDERAPRIVVRIDTNGNGNYDDEGIDRILVKNVTPEAQAINVENGRVLNTAGTIRIGNVDATYNRNGDVSSYGEETVIYVPRDTAQAMYAGMITHQSMGNGTFGVFGRRTSAAELDAQRQIGGSATYAGVAVASVRHLDTDTVPPGTARSATGDYWGTAAGQIDFGTNAATITATMDNLRERDGGTIGMTVNGTVGAGGAINGNATFTGLDVAGNPTTGRFQGHAYGPNAETVGGTFAGGDAGDPAGYKQDHVGIAGGLIMNQTGRIE